LVNRSVLLENPRSAAKTILDAPDARLYHDHDTQELLHQTAAWAHEFGSLAYNPLTPRVMNAMLVALSKTAPLQSPFKHSHECEQVYNQWIQSCAVVYKPLLTFYQQQGVFYRQWLRIRELAQRGIVKHASVLRELVPGEVVCHALARFYEGSLCGLSLLRKPESVVRIQVSRIDAVCNGVVQFRAFDRDTQVFGPVGWASRCDMLVLGQEMS
jgi:hypothetical protein